MKLEILHTMTTQEYKELADALSLGGVDRPLLSILEDVETGKLQAWRLRGQKTELILLTCISKEEKHKELWLYLIAGTGWIGFLDEIQKALEEICHFQECKYISGISRHKALDRVYSRFGAEKVGTLFRKAV